MSIDKIMSGIQSERITRTLSIWKNVLIKVFAEERVFLSEWQRKMKGILKEIADEYISG